MIDLSSKILLIGSSGQLGTALLQTLGLEYNIITPDNLFFKNSSSYELTNKLSNIKPVLIINTLAYTAVDKAENDQEEALRLNATFPKILSQWCSQNKCFLIHYSSDYVFSGQSTLAKTEASKAEPVNYYGKTKLLGDLSIRDSNANSIILRCSWIYSVSHNSFLKTMIDKMQNNENLNVVQDQIGTPTSAQWIADVTKNLISNKRLKNCHHLINCVPDGYTSWYNFSLLILKILKSKKLDLRTQSILPINSEFLSQLATRPKNSCLNNQKLKSLLNINMPKWTELLDNELQNL